MNSPAIVFIEDRGMCESTVSYLIRAGWNCLRARGPIRLRQVLQQHQIVLMVFEEGPGNLPLLDDLAEVWRDYPNIPVVHVYTSATSFIPKNILSQVADSIPVLGAGPHLYQMLQNITGFEKPRFSQKGSSGGSELDFRHIWNFIRGKNKLANPGGSASGYIQELPLASSVNMAERAMLKEKPSAVPRHRHFVAAWIIGLLKRLKFRK